MGLCASPCTESNVCRALLDLYGSSMVHQPPQDEFSDNTYWGGGLGEGR